jgi:hypothetical protein
MTLILPADPLRPRRADDHFAAEAAAARAAGVAVVLVDHDRLTRGEAAFIPDLADADAAWAVAERFVELRYDELTGGFVLGRFEDFVGPEQRTWWVDGVCRIVGPHPDLPADTVVPQPDLTDIEPLVAKLGLPFVAVDVARRGDGVWRVVEMGDGQVSDRPAAVSPEAVIGMLFS